MMLAWNATIVAILYMRVSATIIARIGRYKSNSSGGQSQKNIKCLQIILNRTKKNSKMYNMGFDFYYNQAIQPQAYNPWNYPVYFMPCTSFDGNYKYQNLVHYQNFQIRNAVQIPQNQDLNEEKSKDGDQQVEKSEEPAQVSILQKETKKRKYYGTKNTEANIINRTFLFMNCSSKSRRVLDRILKGDKHKIDIFYTMIKILKRNLKKYVNRTYLRSIFKMEKSNIICKLLCKGVKRLQILSMDEFQQVFRKLVLYYFNNEMVTHILSSSRLSKNTVNEHLKRRREIMSYIFAKRGISP